MIARQVIPAEPGWWSVYVCRQGLQYGVRGERVAAWTIKTYGNDDDSRTYGHPLVMRDGMLAYPTASSREGVVEQWLCHERDMDAGLLKAVILHNQIRLDEVLRIAAELDGE